MYSLSVTRGSALVAIVGISFGTMNDAIAQITADNTLPNKSSITRDGHTFNITGGTQAGRNLFHSFSEFSVPYDGTAAFHNNLDIQNIFSRVTGGSVSQIDGSIQANGTANLFLINPSGIVFGQNASLNVGGSFVASTANAIQFGNLGSFSASNPNSPALLTINPSALLFNQIAAESIRYQSISQPSDSSGQPFPTFADGLRVPDGRSLLLVGGDVNVDGANLTALGGRIELGGLAGTGTVGLTNNGNILSLNFPAVSLLSNVNLANDARVSVRGSGGGDIVINANTFSAIDGGSLIAGTQGIKNAGNITVNANDFNISGTGASGQGSGLFNQVLPNVSGNAGNILINTNTFNASSGATINADTFGLGNAGNIEIQTGSFSLTSSTISTIVGRGGSGNPGKISLRSQDGVSLAGKRIVVPLLNPLKVFYLLTDGGFITIETENTADLILLLPSSIFSSSELQEFLSSHEGEAINLEPLINSNQQSNTSFTLDRNIRFVIVPGNVRFFDENLVRENITVFPSNIQAGNISIESETFSVNDEVRLNSNNISLQANGSISIAGVNTFIGNPPLFNTTGNINIAGRSLSLSDNARIQGNNIALQANGPISLAGDIFSNGNVTINAGMLPVTPEDYMPTGARSLSLSDGASIQGNNIALQANGPISLAGDIFSRGDITIDAGTLSINSEGYVSTGTSNRNAGNIFVRADGDIFIAGTISSDINIIGTTGNAGDISITSLNGDISIEGNNFFDGRISSTLQPGTVGNGGNITLAGRSLSLTNGAVLDTSVPAALNYIDFPGIAQGNAGKITIDIRDTVKVAGVNTRITSEVGSGSIGRGGDIIINTNSLSLTDNASFVSRTNGLGDGGDVIFNVGSFSLTNGGRVIVSTNGFGDAGNVIINARDQATISGGQAFLIPDALSFYPSISRGADGRFPDEFSRADKLGGFFSSIFSRVEPQGRGQGGDIKITASSLSLEDGGRLNSSTLGQGKAGSIEINTSDFVQLSGVAPVFTENFTVFTLIPSEPPNPFPTVTVVPTRIDSHLIGGFSSGLLTRTEENATGVGGDIEITTGALRISDGGILDVRTSNNSNGGQITVKANTLNLTGGSQILATTEGTGKAGDITLKIADEIQISGSDPIFSFRQQQFGPEVIPRGDNFSVRLTPRQEQFGAVDNDGANSGVFTRSTSTANNAGEAGQINISARRISLDNSGVITASTASGNGGNINLNVGDLLLLRRGAQISTNAGTASAGGDGGNITINAPNGFVVAVPNENSDITANAFSGAGGRIAINASSIFGFVPRTRAELERLFNTTNSDELDPSRLSTSDITAFSLQNPLLNGTVEINTPDVDPSQGIVELPANLVDAAQQIAAGCNPGGKLGRASLVATGRGGIASSPREPLMSNDALAADWISLKPDREYRVDGVENKVVVQKPSHTSVSNPGEIVKAQSWVKDADGNVVLVAQPPTVTPHHPAQTSTSCLQHRSQ